MIIGGSGFIGKNLIPSLLEKGAHLWILNRGNTLVDGVEQLTADRNSAPQVHAAATGTPFFDAVVDTSSYKKEHTQIAWDSFAGKSTKWIHLSSAAVYKETLGRAPNEDDPIGGAAIWKEYGVEKSEADQFLIDHSGIIPITIFRPPYLYGPHNDNDRESFVWTRAMNKRPVIVPTDGLTPAQFLHVADLCSAIVKTIQNDGKNDVDIYNIASNEPVSLKEWSSIVSASAGLEDTSVLLPNETAQYTPRQYFSFRDYPCVVDTTRIEKMTSWRPQYGLLEGLKKTFSVSNVEWLRTREINTDIEDIILQNNSDKQILTPR